MNGLFCKHFLGNNIFLNINLFNNNIFVSFRVFKQYATNGKWYPTKEGVALNIDEYRLFKSLASEITCVLQIPTSENGVIFTKHIGTKTVHVYQDYLVDDFNETMHVAIENTAEGKEHQKIWLSKNVYNEFLHVLPDVDSELGVILIFCESDNNCYN